MDDQVQIVFCTFKNKAEASEICQHLVKNKLAACCNIFPDVESVYEWDGKTENDHEIFALIKTTKSQYQHLEKEIKMLHSYSVPEILSVSISNGSAAYLDWVIKSVSGGN